MFASGWYQMIPWHQLLKVRGGCDVGSCLSARELMGAHLALLHPSGCTNVQDTAFYAVDCAAHMLTVSYEP